MNDLDGFPPLSRVLIFREKRQQLAIDHILKSCPQICEPFARVEMKDDQLEVVIHELYGSTGLDVLANILSGIAGDRAVPAPAQWFAMDEQMRTACFFAMGLATGVLGEIRPISELAS